MKWNFGAWFTTVGLLLGSLVSATPTRQGGVVYELGNITYFANAKYPKTVLKASHPDGDKVSLVPITVIVANQSTVSDEYLQTTINDYLAGDDVFSGDFLGSLYLSSTIKNTKLDQSALKYIRSLNVDQFYLDSNVFHTEIAAIMLQGVSENELPSGPYTATRVGKSVRFLETYRLYRDEYRDFIAGAYPSNDGTGSFTALNVMDAQWWDPMIPVPSRIHFWRDSRPLAGTRVAIKDLYDMKGLQTSGGSQAWIRVTPVANATAPAIQRLIDVGAVLVGKFKLAQFASGANPWDWIDEHYPFNPRGDGYLTCSASSSGGGCSIAAYDWLDNAIGSDTGSSMRRPAAVSGTFGNRPSQGMISLEGAIPLSWSQDTAGVFSRDPYQWARFAKIWYGDTSLHQDTSITGLPPLDVKVDSGFPKRILYPQEYLPLANPAAQVILENLLANMTQMFNMTIDKFNFTATVSNASMFSAETAANRTNWDVMGNSTTDLSNWTQHIDVVTPLLTAWAALFDGRFPPVDPVWRTIWTSYARNPINQSDFDNALRVKAAAVSWFEENLLFETPESCSESMMICDIGTEGLPSFREQDLNQNANASFLAVVPSGAAISCANICPSFACADYTIPLGQVPYESPVTMVTEQYPVSINMMVRRGCDYMLFDLVEKLADAGLVRSVKTGRTPF
ncbi:amidase family protein [Talaromyces proteolyticus]|uniref:Amidase family protein n=1 Tax=Talaromyces proteolyticus TaxID=1131652 RepID=A0AAD4KFK3_9EURO|nr:amidase family protein [Talaromyces proteolyticus]KAH8690792.1 amidase family protein [Talaromyces proteolyticus]